MLTHDFGGSEEPPPSPPYAVFSDVLATPITWLGEARGVLGVCSREPGRFAEGDIEVVEAFARFASLALHNAESFEERERQTQVQRGFYRIAQVLGTTLSRAETLDALAQAACDALGGDAALVLELQGGAASLAGTHELPGPIRTALAERGTSGRLAGFAEEERILASTELATDERFDGSLREPLVAEGYGSLLCAPVAGVRDQAYAVVVLFRGGRTFTDEDVLLTQHLSGAARGALERSELFEGERRARTFSQRLARVGALLATSLDPAVVLEEVAREAPGLLGADAAVIRLLDRDELVVRAAAGRGTERLLGTSAGSTQGISGAVAQARAPVTLTDAERAAAARARRPPARARRRSRLRGRAPGRARRRALRRPRRLLERAARLARRRGADARRPRRRLVGLRRQRRALPARGGGEGAQRRDPGQHRRRHRRRRPRGPDRPLERDGGADHRRPGLGGARAARPRGACSASWSPTARTASASATSRSGGAGRRSGSRSARP